MSRSNSALKVLHVLDHSLPLHSGYAFRSDEILRAQVRKGWQPAVLTSPKHEAHWEGDRREEETIRGIRYYRTGAIGRGGLALEREFRLMVRLARRIRHVVKMERPDVLHAHSPVVNALASLWVGRSVGIPVVYEIRAFWEDAAEALGKCRQDSWLYKLVRSLETWVCREVDEVAVLCRGLRDDLVQRGISSGKLATVFNGVNVDDFKGCQADPQYASAWDLAGKGVIGFIGSFFRYEGLDLLVHAIAHLARARSDTVLVLVGGGEMESELGEQIHRLNLKNRVIMPGRIAHNRIPGVYALIDILAYPRHSTRLTDLVTPLKPLEAMAMGKALVASDVGGHREIIRDGHTGLLFPAGNVSALVDTLQRLLDDQHLRENLGKEGSTAARREYSWDKATAAYPDVYAKALARSNSRRTGDERPAAARGDRRP